MPYHAQPAHVVRKMAKLCDGGGILQDVTLRPVPIWFTEVLDESRHKAEQWFVERGAKPRTLAGAAAIALIWVLFAAALSRPQVESANRPRR